MTAHDAAHMARALAAAETARFRAAPNPAVGCVIARGETVIATGATGPVGTAHAEARALAAAGEAARGATAYVTLEPCNHHGRTPPCADALIDAGVARVVVATADPNPLAAGGLARLRAAGVEVHVGTAEAEARWQLRGFLSRVTRNRPWVRLKLAASLDGRTAMASGESQWITGSAARADVQWLRAESDCVLTGIGTLLADDPAMTVRLAPDALGVDTVEQPLRVLVDSRLRCPAGARWLREPGRTLIYSGANAASHSLPAEVVQMPLVSARVELGAVLADLARREVNLVHLEAGATLAGAAVQAGVVDELVVYVAPTLLGDAARPLAVLPGLAELAGAPRFTVREVSQIGEDLRVVLIPTGAA